MKDTWYDLADDEDRRGIAAVGIHDVATATSVVCLSTRVACPSTPRRTSYGLLPSFLKHGRCLLPSFRQLRQWGHLPLLWSLSLLDLLSIPSCGMSPLPLLWSLSLLLIVLCKLFGHKDRCILMAFRSAWRAIFLYVCASISPDACGLIPHQPQLARREAASAS